MRTFHVGVGIGHAAQLLVLAAALGASVFVHRHNNSIFADALHRAGVQAGEPGKPFLFEQVIAPQLADVVVELLQYREAERILADGWAAYSWIAFRRSSLRPMGLSTIRTLESTSRQPLRVAANARRPSLHHLLEASRVTREERPARLLETWGISGQGGHESIRALLRLADAVPARIGAPSLLHESPEGH